MPQWFKERFSRKSTNRLENTIEDTTQRELRIKAAGYDKLMKAVQRSFDSRQPEFVGRFYNHPVFVTVGGGQNSDKISNTGGSQNG